MVVKSLLDLPADLSLFLVGPRRCRKMTWLRQAFLGRSFLAVGCC